MVIIDDFLEKDNLEYVINYCLKSSYTYGETDRKTTPPTGMIHNIKSNGDIYNLFESKIRESNLAKGMTLYRMYVNCFSPSEKRSSAYPIDVDLSTSPTGAIQVPNLIKQSFSKTSNEASFASFLNSSLSMFARTPS